MNTNKIIWGTLVACLVSASPALAERNDNKDIDEVVSFASARGNNTMALETAAVTSAIKIEKLDLSANTIVKAPLAPLAPIAPPAATVADEEKAEEPLTTKPLVVASRKE